MTKPVVSISCTTYNHDNFIEDALEGFLIQKTEFPFEIIIHDDASTDKTQDIIKAYQERYPRIIRSILQSENQYSQGKKPGVFLFPMYRGRYIANCEGDDYWTDPDKLQIQVSFLEENPDYVISSHNASIIDEHGNLISESKLPESRKRDFNQEELMSGRSWILTLSRVYRRQTERIPESRYIKNGDTFFSAVMGQYGKSKYHHEIKPAMYRVHSGGIWSSISDEERNDDHINSWFWMYKYFKRIGNKKYADLYFKRSFVKMSANAPLGTLLLAVFRRLVLFEFFKSMAGKMMGKQNARRIRDYFIDLKSKISFNKSSK